VSRVSIPASGSPALDQAKIETFEAHDEMIQAGLCPNGCGPMVQCAERGADLQSCPACGFRYERTDLW
jgi:hypothetical protein